ncbi:MAG: hypothetical protein C0392_10235 [Syntrophus sp. (in: bacteria)]|nr:hypothetical protein [Syntrophus sp. (in: bacteria)]
MDEKKRIYIKVDSIIKEDGKSSYIGEDDYVSLTKDGIIIHFHIKNPSIHMENVLRTVKRAQKIVRDRLDYELENIDISIYGSKEELRQEGRSRSVYASWIAGIFDGKIRIIADGGEEDPEALYIVLTHEIIHLAVFHIGQGQCPYWMEEGVAVYLSQELPDQYLHALKKAIKSDRILPLDALKTPLPVDVDLDIRQLLYSETSSIVEYLVESYGWDAVKSIIRQCRQVKFSELLAGLSLNHYLLEQGWKRWYRNKNA